MSVKIAEIAGRTAAELIRAKRPQSVDRKGKVDFVTEVDLAAESVIREVLETHTPTIPVFAEEGGGARDADTRWIVDPLDGTTNFVHGYPNFAVSIALEVSGRLEAACIVDVMRDEVFCAERGRGATCNGETIRVSTVDALEQGLFVTGFPYDRATEADRYLAYFRSFMVVGHGIRRGGAAAIDLTAIAAGRADGFWEFGLSEWDMAAGALLIEEAGGRVTGFEGEPLRLDGKRTVASNGRIHDEMLAVIARIGQSVEG